MLYADNNQTWLEFVKVSLWGVENFPQVLLIYMSGVKICIAFWVGLLLDCITLLRPRSLLNGLLL